MIQINKIKEPFIYYCQKVIPLAFDESLSYYEVLCHLTAKIKEVIDEQNIEGQAIEELQQKYLLLVDYVDNYFNNLDVQEEINNKLDEMALDGTLENLIGQYIELMTTYTYNSISEMKLSNNLVNGSFTRTSGYYNYDDGGGALYKVREVINTDNIDERLIIALSDENLVAELVVQDNTLNALQLGIKNDGLSDSDISILNDYLETYDVYIPTGDYLLNDNITIERDNTFFNCKGTINIDNLHTITLKANNCNVFIHNINNGDFNGTGFIITNKNNVSTINNNIVIDQIFKTDIGILLTGNHSKGIQYNKITFNLIIANTGIKITLSSSGSWVNENQFHGGRIMGTLGVDVKRVTSQTNYYDGNKFFNIGFEEIEKICNLENANHFLFSGLRTQESITGETWISFDVDSHSNQINSQFRLYMNKIEDLHTGNNSPNIITANSIASSNGDYISDRLKFVGGKPFIYTRPYYRIPISSYYGEGDLTVNETVYFNDMLITCGCDSNKTLNLNLPSMFNDNGVSEFILRTSFLGSATTLNVKNSDGNTIYTRTTTNSETNKYYKFIKNYYTDTNLSPTWIVTPLNT